jgi:hypothetical protein
MYYHKKKGGANDVKKSIFIIISAVILGLFVSSFALAIEDEDEQYATVGKGKNIIDRDPVKYIIPTILRKKYGKLKLDASASAVIGYDANVNLDRYDQDGSMFYQDALGLYAKYALVDDKIFVKGGYDFTWIKYFSFSDPDLTDNVFSTGLEAKISDNITWSGDYILDFVGFPRDEFSKYTMNAFETSVKHYLTDWLYHKIAYEIFRKDYPKWKPRNNRGVVVTERGRSDIRNTVAHQVGVFMDNKTFLKTENKYYFNDSNELFLDFYDYHAFKTKTSLTRILTNKLYGSASFAYQRKMYTQRSVGGQEFDQRDNLYIYGISLFYDIIPSVSLGTSFDYRENNSNENQQKYEDYIVSSGVYAVF